MNWIISVLFKSLLEWLFGKISAAIAIFKKQKKNHDEAKAQAEKDGAKMDNINPNSAEKETNDAIDDMSSRM